MEPTGVLGTGLDFWQVLGLLVTLILGVIAIRITIKFDLNDYLKQKEKRLNHKLKNTCTHVNLRPVSGQNIEGQSLFVSPSGTTRWFCQRCGLEAPHNPEEFDRMVTYYSNHLDEYLKREKQFVKLLKKAGRA